MLLSVRLSPISLSLSLGSWKLATGSLSITIEMLSGLLCGCASERPSVSAGSAAE